MLDLFSPTFWWVFVFLGPNIKDWTSKNMAIWMEKWWENPGILAKAHLTHQATPEHREEQRGELCQTVHPKKVDWMNIKGFLELFGLSDVVWCCLDFFWDLEIDVHSPTTEARGSFFRLHSWAGIKVWLHVPRGYVMICLKVGGSLEPPRWINMSISFFGPQFWDMPGLRRVMRTYQGQIPTFFKEAMLTGLRPLRWGKRLQWWWRCTNLQGALVIDTAMEY